MQGQFVLVRTVHAGVHVGVLSSHKEKDVVLTDARRIWRWRGANTLNELSQKGAAQEWSRISDPVPTITLTDAIEIIPCSDVARENLTQSRWGNSTSYGYGSGYGSGDGDGSGYGSGYGDGDG